MSEDLLFMFGISFGMFYAWATGNRIPNTQEYPRLLKQIKKNPDHVPDCDDESYKSLQEQLDDPDILYKIVKPTFYSKVDVDDLSCKHTNNSSTASTVQNNDETDPCAECTDPEMVCDFYTNYQCVSKVEYCADKWTCANGVKEYSGSDQSNCYTELPESCFGDLGDICVTSDHCESSNCNNGVCVEQEIDSCDTCTGPEMVCDLSNNQCVSKVDYCADKWTCANGMKEYSDSDQSVCDTESCTGNLGDSCDTASHCASELVCDYNINRTCVPPDQEPYCRWKIWKMRDDYTKFIWGSGFCGNPSRRFFRKLSMRDTQTSKYVKCRDLSYPVDPSKILQYKNSGDTESPITLCEINERCEDNTDCSPGLVCMGGRCLPDTSCASNGDCQPNHECINWDTSKVGSKSITIYNSSGKSNYTTSFGECYDITTLIMPDSLLPSSIYGSDTLIEIQDDQSYTDTYRFHRPELYMEGGRLKQNFQRYFHENAGLYFWKSDHPTRQTWAPGHVQVSMQWLFFNADTYHNLILDHTGKYMTFDWRYGNDQFGGRTYMEVFNDSSSRALALNDPVLTMRVLRHPTIQGEFRTVRTKNKLSIPVWRDDTAFLHKFIDFFNDDAVAIYLTGHYPNTVEDDTIIPYQEMMTMEDGLDWGEECTDDTDCKDIFECRDLYSTNKCLFKQDGYCNTREPLYCTQHQSCYMWPGMGGSKPTAAELGYPHLNADDILSFYNVNGRCAAAVYQD